jgi:apolipoprotein N-acyltransferase
MIESIFLSFVISALVIFGASMLLAQSTIFEPLRTFLAKRFHTNFFCKWGWFLITCQMCTSFWLGILIPYSMGAIPITGYLITNGVLASATTVIIGAILSKLECKEQRQGKCGGCNKKAEETEE